MVRESDLDFLLVRPMGVDPAEPQRGSYALLTEKGQGKLEMTVAKEDVALFLGTKSLSCVTSLKTSEYHLKNDTWKMHFLLK